MSNFFKSSSRFKKTSRTDQYGIVLITKDPDKESSRYKNEITTIMRYPQVVKSYSISAQQAMEWAPNLPLHKLPAFALIREGIFGTQSLGHRLENAILCSDKLTEIIMYIEYLKEQD
jgi:hypothetical protein